MAISAKIVRDVKCTCFFAIKDDLENAGAQYIDQSCVVDVENRWYLLFNLNQSLLSFKKASRT